MWFRSESAKTLTFCSWLFRWSYLMFKIAVCAVLFTGTDTGLKRPLLHYFHWNNWYCCSFSLRKKTLSTNKLGPYKHAFCKCCLVDFQPQLRCNNIIFMMRNCAWVLNYSIWDGKSFLFASHPHYETTLYVPNNKMLFIFVFEEKAERV